ncbi:peptidoglycan DD-metalloendopeptidase family protein [Arthrobacter sp. TB 23]|uniref:peptidoglycan DD-metalloendopeptidase family protein n=1 Tax=Arthrobacter sp. TB 23 TaxID=494419 RepID=UPI00056AA29E
MRLSPPLTQMSTTSSFGYRTNPLTGSAGELHTGIDLKAPCATQVRSAAAGSVVEAGWSSYGGGNRIVVDHGNGLKTTYNHLSAINTSVGQNVGQGQTIGNAGTTGNSTGSHLHFEVLLDGAIVDPAGWL